MENSLTHHKQPDIVFDEKVVEQLLQPYLNKKKSVWKLKEEQKLTVENEPFLNSMEKTRDFYWVNLPLPKFDDFKTERVDLEREDREKYPSNRGIAHLHEWRTLSKTYAKRLFAGYLTEADLDVIPFQQLFRGRAYRAADVIAHVCIVKQRRDYEKALENLKSFQIRMDELQKLVSKKGFPFLNGMFQNPTYLNHVTEDFTNMNCSKPILNPTECFENILKHFDFFLLCPLFCQKDCVVEEFCQEGKIITRDRIMKYVLERMIISRKCIQAFRQVGETKIKQYLTAEEQSNVAKLFKTIDEDDIAKQFCT